MNQLYTVAFWGLIATVVLGGVMGIAGIWVGPTDTGRKLFLTDVVLAITCLILAVVTKWLIIRT